jgi:hypothetical protein
VQKYRDSVFNRVVGSRTRRGFPSKAPMPRSRFVQSLQLTVLMCALGAGGCRHMGGGHSGGFGHGGSSGSSSSWRSSPPASASAPKTFYVAGNATKAATAAPRPKASTSMDGSAVVETLGEVAAALFMSASSPSEPSIQPDETSDEQEIPPEDSVPATPPDQPLAVNEDALKLPPEERELKFGVSAEIMLSHGVLPKFGASVEGERWRVAASVEDLVRSSPESQANTAPQAVATMRLGYALLATPRLRLRLELGATGLGLPDRSLIGIDVGASAQLAVAGPLKLQAAIHDTPYQGHLLDMEAGVALQFQYVGLHAGWRFLRVDTTHALPESPTTNFSGPAVGLSLTF